MRGQQFNTGVREPGMPAKASWRRIVKRYQKWGEQQGGTGHFLNGFAPSTINRVVRSRFVAMARMTLCASRWVQNSAQLLNQAGGIGAGAVSRKLLSLERTRGPRAFRKYRGIRLGAR